MDNYIQTGDRLDYTVATTAGISSSDVVVIGDHIGVAVTDGDLADVIALQVKGVVELDALTAGDWSVGDALYWDPDALELTTITSSDNTPAGYAAGDKTATTDTTALLQLNG